MYKYFVYGYEVISNMKIPLLIPLKNSETKYKKIHLNIKISNEIICHKLDDKRFVNIDSENNCCNIFNGDIYYKINVVDFTVDIITKSINILQSTMLNIPMSIILTYDKKFLLHCSTVIKDSTAIAFVGAKGMGKSSITTTIVNNNQGEYFCDDTLAISANVPLLIERGSCFIKVEDDVLDLYKANFLYKGKTCSGKNYVYLNTTYKLDSYAENQLMLCMITHESGESGIEEIINTNLKKVLFLNNIVGFKFFNMHLYDLLNEACTDEFLKNMKIVKFNIPYDINAIGINVQKTLNLMFNINQRR